MKGWRTIVYIWFHKNYFSNMRQKCKISSKTDYDRSSFQPKYFIKYHPKKSVKIAKKCKILLRKNLCHFYQKSLLSDRKYLITSKFRPKFQKFIWWNFCHFLVKIFGKIFRWKFHKRIWKISLEFETVLDKVEFLFTSVLNLVHPI